MAKTGEIQKVQGASLAAPSFMQQDQNLGVGVLRQYVKPPRLKVVADMSASLREMGFKPGDLVCSPQNIAVAEMPMKVGPTGKGQVPDAENFPRVRFVPIFFYPEYCQWNPIKLKGTVPAIVSRSTDPNSQLAKLCKNSNTWKQPYPLDPNNSELVVRNVEHLNFLVSLQNCPDIRPTELVLLSFQRGTHYAGTNFAGLQQQRRAPLFGCIFDLRVIYPPPRNGFQFFQPEISNPTEGAAFVEDKASYEAYRDLNKSYTELHKNSLIVADYDDPEEAAEGGGVAM